MRKALSLIALFFMSMTMMAETVRIDFCQTPAEQSADKVVWTSGNVTFTLTKGSSSHNANEYVSEYGLKMFDDQVMTISATGGTTISTVTFNDSPAEPTSTAPRFTALQNCTSEKGWGYTVMTASSTGCTMLGGTLTNGYSGYSHVINADVETSGNSLIGKQFYLYNEATGLYLCAHNLWGTQASLTETANLFSLEEPVKGPAYALYNLDVDNFWTKDDKSYHDAQRLGIFRDNNLSFDVSEAFWSGWIDGTDMVDGIWEISRVDDEFVTVSMISCKSSFDDSARPRRYVTASTEKAEARGYNAVLSETFSNRALFRLFTPDELLSFMEEKAKKEKVCFNFLIQNPDFVNRSLSKKWMLNGEPHVEGGKLESSEHSNYYMYFRNEDFVLEQEITNLPEGEYVLEAQACYHKVDGSKPLGATPKVYIDGHVQDVKVVSPEYESSFYAYGRGAEMMAGDNAPITPIRFHSNGKSEIHKIGFSLEGASNIEVVFDNVRITNVFDDDNPGGIDPDPDGWEVTDSTGVVTPTDSIGGGGGDIIIPGDSIGGGDEPSSTDGILWYEPFTDYAANDVPTGGKYNYVSTNGSSTTKVYNENLAGGEAPELLVSKNGGSFTATVPLNSAKGPFTLSYQANRNISVVVEGGRLGEVTKNDKNYTYTIETDTTSRGTLVIAFQNSTSSNVRLDDIKLTGIIPESGDIIIPSDSIDGGGGDIIIPSDSIDGGGGDIIIPGDNPDHPTSVNSEAYRKLYLDYLNYYYDHVRNHHIATWLYNYVERECDRLDDHFENQEACDNLYAYLLEKFNIIREMVGDTPYNGTSYKPQNFNTEKLDALAIHAEAYYDKIHVSHTGPAYNLSDALRDALLATYEIKTQADIENIYAKLLEEYNDVRRRCGDGPYGEDDEEADSDNPDYANLNSAIRRSGWFIEDLEADSKYADIMGELQNALDEAKKALESKKQSVIDAAAQALEDALLKAQNDKKEMDKQPEVADEEGTPMAPIAPDLSQYTHKMMVHGSPWGINGLNMIMLRDKQGRLVQTMTVEARNGGMEEVLTDSVRTYTYDANKMTEQLSVPEYDSNDVLTLVPMGRKETSYYRMADGGHREVCLEMREDDGVCTPIRKTVTVFDAQGRKVSLKHYALWNGEELEYYYDYTYDEDGGFYTKGQNDWGENVHTYTCYDKNGNQTYKTDYNGLYIYGWDEQNHAQGYKFYRNYNIEDNTCTSVDDSRYYIITEKDAEGRTLTMRNGTGGTKSFTYNGNQETETVSDNGTITTYVRTFDADGRLLKMEKNGTALISEFEWSNLDADKVLGGVNKVDENMNWQISKGTTYWTSDKALISARRRYTFEGWQDDDKTTYNIVPLSLLPAQTTEEGVSIPLGNEGDQITLSSDGEIYLLDKGGKKRYSVSVAGITVSSEGGKITISGWTPVDPSASVKGARRAPEKVNLDGNEYDIYIPQDVVSINDEPMNDLYIPIVMDDIADGITGVATANNGRIYNLQGMEVKNPTKGQIVIIKGRKVLMTK